MSTCALLALVIYSWCYISITIPIQLVQATIDVLESSITMSSAESQSINQRIKEIIEKQANAWETADSNKIIADFADDGLFIVPGSSLRGKQQIKEAADNYFAEFTDTKVTIKRIIVNGNEGAVEWSWREKNKKTGEESLAEDAIIFEMEKEKIKYWREYIDKPSG